MSQFDPGTARFLTQGLQAGLGLGMDAQQIEMQRARQRMFEQQAAEEAQMRLRQREANKRLTGALFQKRGQTPTMAGGQLAQAVTATQPQFPGAASMGQDAFSSMLRGGYPAQQQGGGVGAASGGVMPQMDPLDAISADDVADADPRFQQAYFNAKADRQSQQDEYDQTNKLFGYMNRTGMMRAASPAMVDRFMKFGLSIPEDQQPPWLREKMKDEGEGLKRDYIVMLKNMGVVDDDSQSILNPSAGGVQAPGAGLNRRRYTMSQLQQSSPELVGMIFEQAQKEQEQAQRIAASAASAPPGYDPRLWASLPESQRGAIQAKIMAEQATFEQDVQDAMRGNRNMDRGEAEAFVRQRRRGFAGQENFDQSQRTPGAGATASQMYAMAKDAYERAEMEYRAATGQKDPKKPLETLDQKIASNAYGPAFRLAMGVASPLSQVTNMLLDDPSASPEQEAAWKRLQEAKARLDSFVQPAGPAQTDGTVSAFQPADQSEAALLAAFKARTGRDADLTNDADLQVMEQIEASMRQPR